MQTSENLPIFSVQAQICEALQSKNRLVLHAPTGSGKSTQVPQMLLDDGLAGDGQIVVLQPRRVAARFLARFVAQQRLVDLGGEVGYQVRFDSKSSAATRIKFETDGILLRQSLLDPDLSHVSVVVFDEFHERHLYGDVLLSRVKLLQETTRPDLKIVVMSATLESDALASYLSPCPIVETAGRTYPVEIVYAAKSARQQKVPVWQQVVAAFEADPPPDNGHTLVFMPGAYEIRKTVAALSQSKAARDVDIVALHGDQRPEDQDRALTPGLRPRVIVATNIAETSLTIPGVTQVIDSGLARKAAYDARRGINTLLIERISRASADQRSGRAGRTAPGRCIRLWSERDHFDREAQERPEIERLDLAELLLSLAALGSDTIDDMEWLNRPPTEHVQHARDILLQLGAIASTGDRITPHGRLLVKFPCHPRFAAMLVTAERYGCVPFAALVAALSQERSILLPARASHLQKARDAALGEPDHQSDVLLEVRAWSYAASQTFGRDACEAVGVHGATARRVGQLQKQMLQAARQAGLSLDDAPVDGKAAAHCILAGFSDHVGRQLGSGTRYALVGGRRASLAKDSLVKGAPYIVATDINEIGHGSGETDVRLGRVTSLTREWLEELYPDDIIDTEVVAYDRSTKRVCNLRQRRFRDLVLDESRGGTPDPQKAAEILAAEVVNGNLTLKHCDNSVEQIFARMDLLAEHCPEFGVRAAGDDFKHDVITALCKDAYGYKDIKNRTVMPVLERLLDHGTRSALDHYAPLRLKLSNGRTPKVVYESGAAPRIAMRVQELYDVREAIYVADKRARVLVHILAPNQRPVQITDDMASFWDNTYAQVKKDLRGRYPKHEWR
ncbi:MAG: ATP-dependent helicase HrpB [Kiritimatiellae bacterium]|nr:ATP-dependent helicase HrpB [Kiritimatiellia bacterium]